MNKTTGPKIGYRQLNYKNAGTILKNPAFIKSKLQNEHFQYESEGRDGEFQALNIKHGLCSFPYIFFLLQGTD